MSYFKTRDDVVLGQKLYYKGIEELQYTYLGNIDEGELFISDNPVTLRDITGIKPSVLLSQRPSETFNFHKESLEGKVVIITDLTNYTGDSFDATSIDRPYEVEEEGDRWVRIEGVKVSKKRVSALSTKFSLTPNLEYGDVFSTAYNISRRITDLFVYIGNDQAIKLKREEDMILVPELDEAKRYSISPSHSDFRIISPNINRSDFNIVTRSSREYIFSSRFFRLSNLRDQGNLNNFRHKHMFRSRMENVKPAKDYDGGILVDKEIASAFTNRMARIIPTDLGPVDSTYYLNKSGIQNVLNFLTGYWGEKEGVYRLVDNINPELRSVSEIVQNEMRYIGSDHSTITTLNSAISEIFDNIPISPDLKLDHTSFITYGSTNNFKNEIIKRDYGGTRVSNNPLEDPKDIMGPPRIRSELPLILRYTSIKLRALFGSRATSIPEFREVIKSIIGTVKRKNRDINVGDKVKYKRSDDIRLEKNGVYIVDSIDTRTIRNKKMVWVESNGKQVISDIRNFKRVKE